MSRLLLCWFWCSQTLCAVLQKPKIQPVYMRQYVKITFPKIYHVELSSLQSHISKLKSGPNIFLVPDKPGGNLTDIKHYFIYMHKSNRTKYAAQWFFKYNNTHWQCLLSSAIMEIWNFPIFIDSFQQLCTVVWLVCSWNCASYCQHSINYAYNKKWTRDPWLEMCALSCQLCCAANPTRQVWMPKSKAENQLQSKGFRG